MLSILRCEIDKLSKLAIPSFLHECNSCMVQIDAHVSAIFSRIRPCRLFHHVSRRAYKCDHVLWLSIRSHTSYNHQDAWCHLHTMHRGNTCDSTNAQIEVLMYRSPLHYALAPYALAPCRSRAMRPRIMRPCAMRPHAIRPRIMIVMGSEHPPCPHIPCYSMAYQHSMGECIHG